MSLEQIQGNLFNFLNDKNIKIELIDIYLINMYQKNNALINNYNLKFEYLTALIKTINNS